MLRPSIPDISVSTKPKQHRSTQTISLSQAYPKVLADRMRHSRRLLCNFTPLNLWLFPGDIMWYTLFIQAIRDVERSGRKKGVSVRSIPVHCQLFFIVGLDWTRLWQPLDNFDGAIKLSIDQFVRGHCSSPTAGNACVACGDKENGKQERAMRCNSERMALAVHENGKTAAREKEEQSSRGNPSSGSNGRR